MLSLVFYQEFSRLCSMPSCRNFGSNVAYFQALLEWEGRRFRYVKERRSWCLAHEREARKLLEKADRKQ